MKYFAGNCMKIWQSYSIDNDYSTKTQGVLIIQINKSFVLTRCVKINCYRKIILYYLIPIYLGSMRFLTVGVILTGTYN